MDSAPGLPTVGGDALWHWGRGPGQAQEELGWQPPPRPLNWGAAGRELPMEAEARQALGRSQGCGHSPPRPKPPSWKQLCCSAQGTEVGGGDPLREALAGEREGGD